jgi:hypothetical protein
MPQSLAKRARRMSPPYSFIPSMRLNVAAQRSLRLTGKDLLSIAINLKAEANAGSRYRKDYSFDHCRGFERR